METERRGVSRGKMCSQELNAADRLGDGRDFRISITSSYVGKDSSWEEARSPDGRVWGRMRGEEVAPDSFRKLMSTGAKKCGFY